MKKIVLSLLFSLCFTQAEAYFAFNKLHDFILFSGMPTPFEECLPVCRYLKNPNIPESVWEDLAPYFLPEDYPIKKELDKIFSASRVTLNRKSLIKAGFAKMKPSKFSRTTVTTHPKLKGYILKLFLDDQEVDEWIQLKNRIIGALEIKKAIVAHGYQDLFAVPNKWIYPLPLHPNSRANGRYFILIAEKLNLLPEKENIEKWRSSSISTHHLDAVYTVLKEVGLWDSVFPFNLPFLQDGRLAFIDTEIYHRWPVYLIRLSAFLSAENRTYWRKLVQNDKEESVLIPPTRQRM